MKGRRLKSSASPNNNNNNNDKKKEKKRQERPAPNESIGSETARKTSESFSSKANDVSLFAVPKKNKNKNNKKRNEIKEKVWKACFFFLFLFLFFLWPWVGSEKYWMSTTVAEKELHSRRQTIREIRSGGMNGRRFLFFSAPLDDTTFLERAAGHARPFLERRTAETPKRNIKSKTTTTTKETGYFLIDFHYRRRRKRNLPELERNEFKSGSMKKKIKNRFLSFHLFDFRCPSKKIGAFILSAIGHTAQPISGRETNWAVVVPK